MLVNGVRISSFRELRSYPPEAIQKVEVFPEEVAQRYGYSPDQRVVNIILKRNFSSREVEAQYSQPWEGDTSTTQLEATYLKIIGQSRLNFNLGLDDTSLLTEAERGVIQSTARTYPSDPDPAEFRSLIADTAGIEGTANFTTKLGSGGSSLSVNATFERNDSLRYQGIDSVTLTAPAPGGSAYRTFNADDPLTVDSRTDTFSLGTTLNTNISDWQITGTADGSLAKSRSISERFANTSSLQTAAAAGTLPIDGAIPDLPDAGADTARSRNTSLSALVTAMGHPLLLPAGEVAVTLDAGYSFTGLDSEDTRNPGLETSLDRGDLSAGINVSIPIASRREEHWAAIGDLSFNVQAGVDHLSDFGTLTDVTLGLNWGVTEKLNLGASYIMRDAAPSLGQLGNPEVATFNVPVYDISRNETVLATIISGGNPNLPAQSQKDWRFSLNWELPHFWDAIQQARFNVEYSDNYGQDVAAGFPTLTPTIEAAFPDRVTRDATGRLVSIDQRPVSYTWQKSKRIGVNFNMTGPFGKARPQAAAAAQAANPLQQVFARPTAGRAGRAGRSARRRSGWSSGAGGGFNPQVFQDLRTKFCTPEAASAVPTAADLEGLPQQLLEPDQEPRRLGQSRALGEFRTNMCSGNGTFVGGDPARLPSCASSSAASPGQTPPPITEEQLAALAAADARAAQGPDGKVDPERVNQLRTQFCSANPQQQGQQRRSAGPGSGGQQGGPVIVFGGPGRSGRPGRPGRLPWPRRTWWRRRLPRPRRRRRLHRRWRQRRRARALLRELQLHLRDRERGAGRPRRSAARPARRTGARGQHAAAPAQLQRGLFYAGYGLNMNARYAGASRIDGSGLPGSTDLFFGDIFTVGFRVFADLNQRTKLIEDVPLLKNTRVTLGNEQRVRRAAGDRRQQRDGAGALPAVPGGSDRSVVLDRDPQAVLTRVRRSRSLPSGWPGLPGRHRRGHRLAIVLRGPGEHGRAVLRPPAARAGRVRARQAQPVDQVAQLAHVGRARCRRSGISLRSSWVSPNGMSSR
jgi:hypothetical protein